MATAVPALGETTPGRWARVGGGAGRFLRTAWTLPVGALAVGWVLRETSPFAGSTGDGIAALLGVVAPTSLTFPCWLRGAPPLRGLWQALGRRRPSSPPSP